MKKQPMQNRLITAVVTVALVLGLLPFGAGATNLSGNGTKEAPYLISTAEELAALSEFESVGFVTLQNDIDMSSSDGATCLIKKLTGTFDGGNHKLTGLKLVGGNNACTGLVGTLCGKIQNLDVEGATLTDTGTTNNAAILAGFVPAGSTVNITGCRVSGTITGTGGNSYTYIGGFIGYVDGNSDDNTAVSISGCVQNVAITAPSSSYAGGFIGSVLNFGNITVENCAILGGISGSAAAAGGVVGFMRQGGSGLTVNNSYLGAKINGNKKYSIAYNMATLSTLNVENFYYDSTLNSSSSWDSFDAVNKGNYSVSSYVVGKSTAEIKALSLSGFAVEEGLFNGYPIPARPSATTPDPPESSYSCTVSFENIADGTLTVYKGENTSGDTVAALDGKYTLTEKGTYTYTLIGCTSYEDITGAQFTVGDGDNGTEKIIRPTLVRKPTSLLGSGTRENPYLISTADELYTLADKVNDTLSEEIFVSLENDISLTDVWTPLGKNSVNAFRGTFDGNNHSITLSGVSNKSNYFGFFGCVIDSTVKNLTVCGAIYCGEPGAYVGGVCARARGNVTFENVTNRVNVSTIARSCLGAGGIVGGYDDNVEYKNESVCITFKSCENSGILLVSGTDAGAYVGGILGSNKNCARLTDCTSRGEIYSPGTYVGGLLGQAGSSAGDCVPLIKNCTSLSRLTGANGKTGRLYGKGRLSASCIEESGSNTYTAVERTSTLLDEAEKYLDIVSVTSAQAVGSPIKLLKDNLSAAGNIDFAVKQTESDISLGYVSFEGNVASLAKLNTEKTVKTETATLSFSDGGTNVLYKTISFNIYPSDVGEQTARQSLMHNIAKTYAGSSDEWVVFDMAAYATLGLGENTANFEKYLNTAANTLCLNTPLVTDRAKAEIIFRALGKDASQITAYDKTSYSNTEKLAAMQLGNSIYDAPWVLLAMQCGKLKLTDEQQGDLLNVLYSAQDENGLFFYEYGGEKYYDCDTTATAVAALSVYYDTDTKAKEFTDKAVAGLSAAQGEDGSFGNPNTDAFVIIGLAAAGISPITDERFIKNNISLADALMLYANDTNDGFTTPYATGDYAESARALATEQGFRALIVCEKAESCTAFNVYTFDESGSIAPVKPLTSAPFTATAPTDNDEDTSSTPSTDTSSKKNITAEVEVIGKSNEKWLTTTVTLASGSSVAEFLKKAFADGGLTAVGINNGYITSITKDGTTLSQRDDGPNSGWLYTVNGKSPNVGIKDYTLSSAADICVYYTTDYTTDESSSKWSSGGSGGKKQYTLSFVTNGGGKISSVTASSGQCWTRPANPVKDGCEFDGWYTDKALTQKFDFSQKAGANITLYAKWSEASTEPTSPFADVKNDDPYFEYISFVYNKGLMTGMSADTFSPYDCVTRAELCTVLYRMAGAPVQNGGAPFSDTLPQEWYFAAVSWAYENNLVNGYGDNTFLPDAHITREEAVLILYRFARFVNADTASFESTDINTFSDFAEVSDYATAALRFGVGSGIILGDGDALFPAAVTTRAQAAAVLTRFFRLYK